MNTKLTLQEIDKQLAKTDLAPNLKNSLEQKKKILSTNKTVNK